MKEVQKKDSLHQGKFYFRCNLFPHLEPHRVALAHYKECELMDSNTIFNGTVRERSGKRFSPPLLFDSFHLLSHFPLSLLLQPFLCSLLFVCKSDCSVPLFLSFFLPPSIPLPLPSLSLLLSLPLSPSFLLPLPLSLSLPPSG